MTSRQSEKRTMRKCELSLESLHARIAPAGFHAGSLFVAGMHGHFENAGGTSGKHHSVNLNLVILNRHAVKLHHHSTPVTSPFELAVNPPVNVVTTTSTSQQTNNAVVTWQARGTTTSDQNPPVNIDLTTSTSQQTNNAVVTWQARGTTTSDQNPPVNVDLTTSNNEPTNNNSDVTWQARPTTTTDVNPPVDLGTPASNTAQTNNSVVTWQAR